MEAARDTKIKEDKTHTIESSMSPELKVTLESLEKLTGFPKEFIKNELSLSHDEVSMVDLRKSVLNFLDQTLGESNNLS